MGYERKLQGQFGAKPHVWSLLMGVLLVVGSDVGYAQSQPITFSEGFKGEECDPLAATLRELGVAKDEFETTAAYEQRIQSALNSRTVSGRPLAEPMLFVNSDRISGIYDADRGYMKIYGSLRQTTEVSESIQYASTVIVNVRSAESSQYQAQNRFGVSTTVDRYRDEVCGVAFLNVSPVTDLEWMSTIEFPLAAEVARRSKDNMAVVYLARLAPPLLVDFRQSITPTLDSPGDIMVTGDALTAVLEQFFVINQVSGEVLFERVYTPR